MPEINIDSTTLFWGLTCVIGAVIMIVALFIGSSDE